MEIICIFEKTNIMKIYIIGFVLLSLALSAQASLRKPLKVDSAKFPKIEKSLLVTSPNVTKLDSSIAKLYKMPVAKPKNPELYASLKAPKRDNTLYKIPNLLEVAEPPKLAAK